MEKTLRELAEYLQGTLENEDQKLIVTGVNGLVEAGPQDISFAVPPHVEHCHLSKAGVMVLAPEDPKLDRQPHFLRRKCNQSQRSACSFCGLVGAFSGQGGC